MVLTLIVADTLAPLLSSFLTTSTCSLLHAQCRAVHPLYIMITITVLGVTRYVISLLFTVTSNVTSYYCMTSNVTEVRLLMNVTKVMRYKSKEL